MVQTQNISLALSDYIIENLSSDQELRKMAENLLNAQADYSAKILGISDKFQTYLEKSINQDNARE